jgi:hypothetical protein
MLQGKLPAEWCLLTKLGPQVRLFPVPIFGVNTNLTGVPIFSCSGSIISSSRAIHVFFMKNSRPCAAFLLLSSHLPSPPSAAGHH